MGFNSAPLSLPPLRCAEMLRERAECHLVNGFSCLGQPELMPSYHPHLPQQASQECFLQGGSCTCCHSSRSLGEAAAGRDINRQDGIWPSSRLGHPPPQENQVSQIAEKLSKSMSWTARNLQQKTQASPLLLLGVLGYQTCCVPLVFSRKAWVLTQFFSSWGK